MYNYIQNACSSLLQFIDVIASFFPHTDICSKISSYISSSNNWWDVLLN